MRAQTSINNGAATTKLHVTREICNHDLSTTTTRPHRPGDLEGKLGVNNYRVSNSLHVAILGKKEFVIHEI